jgi:hypothetical protein
MANTYTSLHYHFITFSTKNRQTWIAQKIEKDVWAYLGGISCRILLRRLPIRSINPLDFGVDVLSFIERQPAAEVDGFAGGAIGKLRVAVEAGAGWVGPGALAGFPGGDDPATDVPCRRAADRW